METLSTHAQPFFEWLLRSTIQAGIVVCLILVIQALLRNRLTARWHYALWLILVVRMVLPWAPQSRFSIYNLTAWQTNSEAPAHVTQEQNAEPVKTEAEPSTAPQSTTALKTAGTTEGQVENSPAATGTSQAWQDAAAHTVFELSGVLPFVWLAGVILLGGYIVVCNLRLWRAASVECPSTDKETLELLEECRAAMGLRTIVALIPSETVNTPILLGFVRPRLLVPKNIAKKLSREELRYIFLHELAHVKRHDIALGWLTALLQMLHWFNPLVWLAFHRMRSSREAACDALVLSRMQGDRAQSYGLAIVSLLEHFSVPQPLPGLAGILETKSQLKRRIAMITQFRNNSYRWSPLAVILVIILTCISLPDAERSKASEIAASQPANQPKFTKIQIPNKIPSDVQLSPNGKSIALALEKKLWILPTVGKLGPDYPGTPTLLNTGDREVEWAGLTWSRDGQWIAFNDAEVIEAEKQKGKRRMYVVSVEGGKPKEVYDTYRDARIVNYRMSLSPNGKTLAFSSVDANELHIYTIGVDGGSPRRLVETPAREPVFSPDGTKIAYVEDKLLGRLGGGLWVVPAEGGPSKLVADAGNASSPVWSPEGRMIAFLDGEHICLIPVGENGECAGEKTIIRCPEGFDNVARLTGWTPDNKIGAIFAVHSEFGLYTLPLRGGQATLIAHGGYYPQPRWSPDGKRIIHSVNVSIDPKGRDGWVDFGLASVSAQGGEATMIPIQADAKIVGPPWGGGNHVSPDGKTIVFAGRRLQEGIHTMHIWTLPIEGGRPRQLTNASTSLSDWYPCWSPDGNAIAFVRTTVSENSMYPFGTSDIYILPAEGGEPRQLTHESDMVDFGSIAWSPDGKLLAYHSADNEDSKNREGSLRVIPVEGGESRVVTKLGAIHVNIELAWSADSRRIAFNDRDDKTIKIVSLDDGTTMDVKPNLANISIWHLDWSRDGDRLVFAGSQGGGPEFWMVENFLPREASK